MTTIDPSNLDARAVKSYKAGDESVTMRSASELKVMNELEGVNAVACDPTLAYNFLNSFNFNVTAKHFPNTFDSID